MKSLGLRIPEGEFEAFIYDCDGTIADSMPLHYVAWCKELEQHGCPFPKATFYAWAGIPTERIVEMLNERHGLEMRPTEVALSRERRYLSLLPELKAVPEVLEHIQEHQGKKPMAVASGSSRDAVKRSLKALGLGEVFKIIVGAEDCKRGKPAPDVFLEAARQLGVDPKRCLVFEDAEFGIQAAEAAGMAWVRIASPN